MAELAFPWEREAMRNEPLPEGLKAQWEQYAFLSLRRVYRDYYSGAISRETAALEKHRIVSAARDAKKTQDFQDRLADCHQRVLRRTEAARTACRKAPTPENGLRLCDVIDGLEKG